jgi:dTDP-4-amino-4,6-dideoxygalactose transaminase
MPVHCYGLPCDVEAIQRIADTYNLRVIYDAAQAFGVKRNGSSVLNHGDLSVVSFHATKVFNTFEGGGIICPDAKTKSRIDHLKNFGFVDETTVIAPGINGKMSEFNAALGLLQLKYVDQAIARRSVLSQIYRDKLAHARGIHCLEHDAGSSSNHSYFPILIGPEYRCSRDALYFELKAENIHPRRYFFPLVSDFPMYRGLPSALRDNLPVATGAAQQVICLPIYPDLSAVDQNRIIDILLSDR